MTDNFKRNEDGTGVPRVPGMKWNADGSPNYDHLEESLEERNQRFYENVAQIPDDQLRVPKLPKVMFNADGTFDIVDGEEISDRDLRDRLKDLITKELSKRKDVAQGEPIYPSIVDVFPDSSYFVYEFSGLFMRSYEEKDGEVKLTGTDSEVQAVTSYKELK